MYGSLLYLNILYGPPWSHINIEGPPTVPFNLQKGQNKNREKRRKNHKWTCITYPPMHNFCACLIQTLPLWETLTTEKRKEWKNETIGEYYISSLSFCPYVILSQIW